MKKAVIAIAVVAMALVVPGCARQAMNDTPEATNEPKTAEVGETVPVQTKNGDIEITVDAFEDNAKATDAMAEYGHISDGQRIGLLKVVVKNMSYEAKDSSLADYIDLTSGTSVIDAEGISLNDLSSAFDIGEYAGAAGGMVECKQGESKRAAIFYPIDAGASEVTVKAGDYTISVPVTKA